MRWVILLLLVTGCTNPQINIYTQEKQQPAPAAATDFYPDQTKFYPDKPQPVASPVQSGRVDYTPFKKDYTPIRTDYTPIAPAPDNCGTPTEPRKCDYGSVTAYPTDYGTVTAYPVPKKAR
jgi:hypothetical protein